MTLIEAAENHIASLDGYDGDLVPINRTRGTAAALREALRASLDQSPAALAGEREAFDESSFDLPPLGVSNPLVGLIAAGGEPAKKIQDYLWECGRAGWSARTIADPTTFLDGKATSWIATCPKCDCSIHFASRPTTQAPTPAATTSP